MNLPDAIQTAAQPTPAFKSVLARQRKTFLAALVVALIILTLSIWPRSPQQAAIARVKQLGGYGGFASPAIFNWIARHTGVRVPHSPSRYIHIVVEGKQVTDIDVDQFSKAFPDLQGIDLSSTRVSTLAIANLGTLRSLETISIRHTSTDDGAITSWPVSSRLICLDLAGTSITDKSLVHLAKFPRLGRLSLSRTNITDQGAESLLQARAFSHLDLEQTAVSSEMIARLKQKFPNANILGN